MMFIDVFGPKSDREGQEELSGYIFAYSESSPYLGGPAGVSLPPLRGSRDHREVPVSPR